MQTYQLIALAMLLGSIPFRTLAKLHRKRQGLEARPRPLEPMFLLVGVLDAVKVALPVYLAARGFASGGTSLLVVWVVALVGILSDMFPYWLMFKPQGSGMAPVAGLVFGLNPAAGAAALAVYASALIASDKLSLAAIAAAVSAPVWLKVFHSPMAFLWIGLVGFAYVMMVHSANIARIIDGSEPGWYKDTK